MVVLVQLDTSGMAGLHIYMRLGDALVDILQRAAIPLPIMLARAGESFNGTAVRGSTRDDEYLTQTNE